MAVVAVFLAALSVVASAPSPSTAATTVNYSAEVSGTSAPARATAQSWGNAWKTSVIAAGGVPSGYITFNQPTYVVTPTPSVITGTIYTAADGTTVSVQRTKYSYPGSPSFVGTSTQQGLVTCTASGGALQGGSPRPTDLVETAGCPTTTLGSKGFAYDAVNGAGENTTRDAVEFTFSKPVLAFGAWFGDVETRTVAGGLPAIVRLYGASGTLLAEQQITPSTADQTLCGDTFTGCGNNQTRWIDFIADPTQPVSRMVVIVGDDDATVVGNAINEGLGFIGAMVATMPELTATKVVASGTPINLGTGQYEVTYNLSVKNTGGSALNAVGLVDNLAATFSPIPAASIVVMSTAVAGSVVANPAYNGTTNTQLLVPASSTLAVGATFTASITVRVTPGANLGSFANTATASGSAGTTTVTDSPDVAASVTLSEKAGISTQKSVVSTTSNGDGTQSIAFSVDATNTGDVALSALAVDDSLTAAFGAQFISTSIPVASVPGAGSSVIANPGFNGDTDANLVTAASVLAPGHTVTLTFTALISATSAAPGTNASSAAGVSPAGKTVNSNAKAAVTIPFIGALSIDKVIDGPALEQDSKFPFEVDCGSAGSFGTAVTVAAGSTTGTTTIKKIPALASCVVTEGSLPDAPLNYYWAGTTIATSPVTIVDGAAATVTVTNHLALMGATVVVVKTIKGGPASDGESGTFDFLVDCGADGTFSGSVTLPVQDGASDGVKIPVPAFAECTVSETASPGAPAGFHWSAPAQIEPASVKLGPGESTKVLVTNTLGALDAAVVIIKTIKGGPPDAEKGTFVFTVDCGAAGLYSGEITIPLVDGSSGDVTIPVPSSVECTVSESAVPAAPLPYVWIDPVMIEPGTVKLEPGNTIKVSVTNQLHPMDGTVVITKTIKGGPASGDLGTFEFLVDCGPDGSFPASVELLVTDGAVGSTNVTVPSNVGCSISESTVPAAPAGYSWLSSASIEPGEVKVGPTESVDVSVVNSLVPVDAVISVTKSIQSGPASAATGIFEFTADCGTAGSYFGSLELALQASATGTVDIGVPSGFDCAISETSVPAPPSPYFWVDPPVVDPSTVSPASGETIKVAVLNTLRKVDSTVVVTKTISGGPASGESGTFEFTVDCGLAGVFVGSVDVAVQAGASASVSIGMPSDTPCEVSETGRPASPTNYFWVDPPVVEPTSVFVAAGSETAVEVVNTLSPQDGTVTITKTIAGGPAAGDVATFGFTVDCGVAGSFAGSLELPVQDGATGSVGVTIPALVECTVSESSVPSAPEHYSWSGDPVVAPGTVSIDPAGSAAVTVTNSLTKNDGAIHITKTVVGAAVDGVIGEFGFTVTCGTWSTDATIDFAAPGATEGDVLVSVPADITCDVAETTVPTAPTYRAWESTTIDPETVTVGSDETAEVGVVNSLRSLAGALTITKSVAGGPVDGISGDFDFTADCGPAGTFEATVSLTGQNSASAVLEIPVATTLSATSCEVTESSTLPAPPAFFDWSSTTGSPATVSLTDGGAASATITNTLTPITGELSITKTVTGIGSFTGSFDFSVECGAVGTWPVTISLTDASTASSSLQIPVASAAAPTECTVTETARADAPVFYAWVGDLPAPVETSVAATAGSEVTITNDLRTVTGSLQITKTVDGGPAGGVTGSFPMTVDCAAAGTFSATVELTASTTGTATVTGIPAPSACSVTEETLPAPPANYFWTGSADINPTTVSVIEGAVSQVSVTNHLTQQTGTLTIVLDISDGPAEGISGAFVIAIDCGESGSYTMHLIFDHSATATGAIDDIPVPTTCEITEVSRPPAPAGFLWKTLRLPAVTTGVTAAPVTITTMTALQPQPALAATGNAPAPISMVMLVLLGAGAALLVVARRRRSVGPATRR